MTRAKNNLHIFKILSEPSSFIREIDNEVSVKESKTTVSQNPAIKTGVSYSKNKKTELTSNFDLVSGERVIQVKYGPGVVNSVEYDLEGNVHKFTVKFDSGEEKSFIFPIAFKMGMVLESGFKIDIQEKTIAAKPVSTKR